MSLYQKHGRMIEVFVFLFLGFLTTFLLIFVATSQSLQADTFAIQLHSINDIRAQVSGSFTETFSPLTMIIANNFQVLLFCVLFSFFYGAGAIFILSWNASVMGAAIGGTMERGFAAFD